MKKIILLLLCLAALAVSAAENIFIYLAPDAILPEKTAAEELKKGLQKIFGINAQLLQQSPEKCTFWVGQSKEAGKALKIADFPGLKTDEIILKKYEPGCIFCNDARNVKLFKGKRVCEKCIAELFKAE